MLFYLIGSVITGCAVYIMHKIDGFNIVKQTLTEKYERFRELNKLVETRHNNQLEVVLQTP